MDILPTETLQVIATAFKLLFLIAAGLIVLVNYFQAKEAQKMEGKLKIALPGSVTLAVNVQLFFSVLFLFVSIISLFLF